MKIVNSTALLFNPKSLRALAHKIHTTLDSGSNNHEESRLAHHLALFVEWLSIRLTELEEDELEDEEDDEELEDLPGALRGAPNGATLDEGFQPGTTGLFTELLVVVG